MEIWLSDSQLKPNVPCTKLCQIINGQPSNGHMQIRVHTYVVHTVILSYFRTDVAVLSSAVHYKRSANTLQNTKTTAHL